MKKTIGILVASVALVATLGAVLVYSMANDSYTSEEREVIAVANELVSEKYGVAIDEGDFSYSVGRQIGESAFVSLGSQEEPQKGYENIMSVSALKKSVHKKGEVYSFAVTFNSQTKEVLDISVSVG